MSDKIENKPLILESIDIDLNKLFSLSYTFDNLKSFMSSLSKNQSLMTDKINELENNLKQQKDLNNKYHTSFINFNRKLKSLESTIIKALKKDNKLNIIPSKKEKQNILEIKNEQKKEEDKSKTIVKDKKDENNLYEIKEKKELDKQRNISENTLESKVSDSKKDEVISEREKDISDKVQEKKDLDSKKEEVISAGDKDISDNKKEEVISAGEKDVGDNMQERKISDNINISEKALRKESSFSKNFGSEFNNENLDDSLFNENQELIEIKKRLNDIESKLKEYNIPSLNNVPSLNKELPLNNVSSLPQSKPDLISGNFNKEEIYLIKNEINNLNKKTEEILNEKEELKKKVEEINTKVSEFNILDLLKKSASSGGSQLEADKLYALNLEQKFQRKTNILDDRAKRAEEEINKIKNNLDGIKNNFEIIEDNFNLTKNNIKDLKEEIMKSNVDYRNLISEINEKLNENVIQKIEAQKRGVNKNLNQLREQIKSINNKGLSLDVDINKIGSGLSDNDLKYISELSKKVSDVEKQVSLILRNMDSVKNKDSTEITKIENELTQKVNQKDFFELNDKVNLQNTISNNIREMVERVQDLTNKNMKDLNFFLRKIESLSGTVVSMQTILENITGIKQENQIDLTNYIEQESFNEFIKNYNKDKKMTERNFDEFRRIITDLTEIIKSKAGEDDLKNFETIFLNKLEELKINCGKKFADKIDTSKNLKYLDAEIKYINEFFIKKDKNDNWLIAKKPVGGFTCASCETYIGDLKEKGNNYIAWNKYPQREKSIEKNYRVGNGFSRMLNMLNIDIKNSVDNYNINSYESEDENNNQQPLINHQINNNINFNIRHGLKTSASNKNKNNLKKSFNQIFAKNGLPKINSYDNFLSSDNSIENYGMNKTIESSGTSYHNNDGIKNNESDKKPCIVKVFRKNK